jgi:hypothetical protein
MNGQEELERCPTLQVIRACNQNNYMPIRVVKLNTIFTKLKM